jgi:phosphate transport system protein
MQISFDEELGTLKEKILLMGSKVEEAIRLAMKSLVDRDTKLARQIIRDDRDINELEIEVDDVCHRLLALHQPMASDMRFITSVMKINSDLERMGDMAVNIAERAITLNELPPLKPLIDIPRMAAIAQEMVKVALDSLVNRDPDSAKKVCERDDEVDNLNDQIIRELLSYMIEDRAAITRALNLIFISRYLERVADHATNIGEDVIYMVNGKDIRHRRG